MELTDVIQQIVKNSISNMSLTDYATGIVTSTNPLKITKESTMLPLPRSALILTETVTNSENPLTVGDKVVMLSVMNGQNFIVLSRVVL